MTYLCAYYFKGRFDAKGETELTVKDRGADIPDLSQLPWHYYKKYNLPSDYHPEARPKLEKILAHWNKEHIEPTINNYEEVFPSTMALLSPEMPSLPRSNMITRKKRIFLSKFYSAIRALSSKYFSR
jgi:hypothetical protein